jgi:hypothetical protein
MPTQLSLRLLAHKLIMRGNGPTSFSVAQIMNVVWNVFTKTLGEGKLRLSNISKNKKNKKNKEEIMSLLRRWARASYVSVILVKIKKKVKKK